MKQGNKYDLGNDGMPFNILNYVSGPGFEKHRIDPLICKGTCFTPRWNPIEFSGNLPHFKQDSGLWLDRNSPLYSGADTPVFATGPMAHLFSGVHDSTYVPHAIMYASCIGPHGQTGACGSKGPKLAFNLFLVITSLTIFVGLCV